MAKSKHFYIRKAHRYLGVILGIQFLLWTIGGLYFSWSNMDEVHGDFEKRKPPFLPVGSLLASPSTVIDSIKKAHPVDSFVSIQLIEILGKPYYQLRGITSKQQGGGHQHSMKMATWLADAVTGQLKPALTKEQAIEVASKRFNGEPKVKSVEYLTATNGHHEYRESPLPAYAITFEHPSGSTVYVASELGTVQKFRNNKWRIFDFLWMLHTMDYNSRDNIGNLLLRIFSIFGLITVFSGFALYAISFKGFKKNPLSKSRFS
ncbi:hypothetical protein FAM09_15165 [Niastella caeni]|uniref:PepSY domain-containing protein n=1 Tax=Niastella caeni TaxID=2569763 RepID=A0A4S8HVF4_9BACT|nr:hypothetical protein [Niastella caeni]THU38024.1 hypothetical protein FAM09_15165 [Niastella caeni]